MSHRVRPDRRTTFGNESWKFDAAGRLISDGTRELKWDAKGRLTRVVKGETVETYTYAHNDARAVKLTQTGKKEQVTRYVAGDVEERDGKLVIYVYLGEKRLARFEGVESDATVGAVVPRGVSGLGGAGLSSWVGWLVMALAAAVLWWSTDSES